MTSSQSLRDPPGRARRRVGAQGELEEPILAELFSVERLEQHAQTLAAADRITDDPARRSRRAARGSPRTAGSCSSRTASSPGRSRTSAGSRRRRNGSSTTSRSSTSSCARSATTCRPTTTASSRSSPDGHLAGYPRVVGMPGPTSPTRTAGSIPRACGGWSSPTRGSSRSRSASCGRSRSACASCSSTTSAGWPSGSCAAGRPASRPTSSPTASWAWGRTARTAAGAAMRRLSRADALHGRPGPALPAPARPGPGRHAGPALARGPARPPGHDGRGDGPPRAPASGHDERDGPQRDHEHAPHLVVRLGRVRRERQPRRRRSCASGARSARWTSRPATATATPSRSWPASPGSPRSRSPGRRPTWPTPPRPPTPAAAGTTAPTPAPADGPVRPPPRREPGYFLISDGRIAFERSLGVRVPRSIAFRRLYVRVASRDYVAAIAILAVAPPRRAGSGCPRSSGRRVRRLVLVTLLALAPASDLAVALVNRSVTDVLGPAPAAPARPRRRRADGPPDARRGADAAHERGRRRGAGQRPGGPLPRQSRGRPALRAPVGLARRPDRARRRATTTCSRPPRPASTG